MFRRLINRILGRSEFDYVTWFNDKARRRNCRFYLYENNHSYGRKPVAAFHLCTIKDYNVISLQTSQLYSEIVELRKCNFGKPIFQSFIECPAGSVLELTAFGYFLIEK